MSAGEFGVYTAEEVAERLENRERLALQNKIELKKHFEIYRGVEGRNRYKNVFARPNGLCENL